jgi:hypothetical protein
LTSLAISEAGVAVKYNVYLSEDAIELQFNSTDRSRVEFAACLLRLAGVSAEVKKKEDGKRDVWYVVATTDALAAGRRELRDAIRKVVEDEKKPRRWLEKLEGGGGVGGEEVHCGSREGRVGGALPLHQPGVFGGGGERVQSHGS